MLEQQTQRAASVASSHILKTHSDAHAPCSDVKHLASALYRCTSCTPAHIRFAGQYKVSQMQARGMRHLVRGVATCQWQASKQQTPWPYSTACRHAAGAVANPSSVRCRHAHPMHARSFCNSRVHLHSALPPAAVSVRVVAEAQASSSRPASSRGVRRDIILASLWMGNQHKVAQPA